MGKAVQALKDNAAACLHCMLRHCAWVVGRKAGGPHPGWWGQSRYPADVEGVIIMLVECHICQAVENTTAVAV